MRIIAHKACEYLCTPPKAADYRDNRNNKIQNVKHDRYFFSRWLTAYKFTFLTHRMLLSCCDTTFLHISIINGYFAPLLAVSVGMLPTVLYCFTDKMFCDIV